MAFVKGASEWDTRKLTPKQRVEALWDKNEKYRKGADSGLVREAEQQAEKTIRELQKENE